MVHKSKDNLAKKTETSVHSGGNRLSRHLLTVIYILPVFTCKEGLVQAIATSIVLIALALLFFSDDFYLALPIMIFFYMYLILPGGIALFRIYSILLVIKVLRKRVYFNIEDLFPFAVITFYSVYAIIPINAKLAVFIVFDVVFLILYVRTYMIGGRCFHSFFRFYLVAAIASTVFGILRMTGQINTAVYIDGEWIYITRFIATYNDPNYLGFFFNIAIFAAISMKLFSNRMLQLLITAILYVALIATLSTTAIICNTFGIIIYLVVSKKVNLKTIGIIMLIMAVLAFSYQTALERDIPILSDAAMKIKSRIIELDDYNISSFTSQRTDIWEDHLKGYLKQSNLKMLIGGNVITGYVYDSSKYKTVSHQEFIDMLLNFGFIGSIIMMSAFFSGVFRTIRRLRSGRNDQDVLKVMIKYTWLFYALGLTMFPGWMFYLFFFL